MKFIKLLYQKTILLLISSICISLLTSPSAFSLTPFADTGYLLPAHRQAVSVHSLISYLSETKETDFNMMLALDTAYPREKSLNMRYFAGAGTSGLYGGAFLKWTPFPDYKWQPAVGLSAGPEYYFADMKDHFIHLHIRPFTSKQMNTPFGEFTPYLAFPVSIQIKNFTQVQIPLSLVLGLKGELSFIDFRKLFFYLELSTPLIGPAPFYISVGVLTPWPDRSADR